MESRFHEFYNLISIIDHKEIDNLSISDIGVVEAVNDGVVTISGLTSVSNGEMILINNSVRAMAINLNLYTVDAVIFSSDKEVKEKDTVIRLQRPMSIPVGVSLLGRVLNALGDPLDDKGNLEDTELKPIEAKAPGIVSRKSIREPMVTGVKIVDSLFPIGRGQRELIIGDRQTGKTSLAIDAILAQKLPHTSDDFIYCVYVAIGQKRSSVAQVIDVLEKNEALPYTVVVSATASEPASLQFLAPYAGCTIGEFFRDNGLHALIVYDDLSKQAVAYRQISLLLRRPPGREAYPGDVFYLHSRLLERAAKLSDKLLGGSLTALPIIETQEGDVSAYIPTNVISITDGQIFLDASLFYDGIKPAVNVGLSVSRVGANAQVLAMKRIAGSLKLELAQFREIARFEKFGADLDDDSKALLVRGKMLTEVLKQDRFKPVLLSYQILVLFAALNKFFDGIPLDRISAAELDLINFASKYELFCVHLDLLTDDSYYSEYGAYYLNIICNFWHYIKIDDFVGV